MNGFAGFVCLILGTCTSFAQGPLVLELHVHDVRYCDDQGIKSIRVHLVIDAKNEGRLPAAIPALVNASRVTIGRVGSNEKPKNVPFIERPITPLAALQKLSGEGGAV